MVNEAPKTIASFARNRLRARARLLSVGLSEVFECGLTLVHDHVARGEEAGIWHSDQSVFATRCRNCSNVGIPSALHLAANK